MKVESSCFVLDQAVHPRVIKYLLISHGNSMASRGPLPSKEEDGLSCHRTNARGYSPAVAICGGAQYSGPIVLDSIHDVLYHEVI